MQNSKESKVLNPDTLFQVVRKKTNLLALLITFKYLDIWYVGLHLYSSSALQKLETGVTKPGAQ